MPKYNHDNLGDVLRHVYLPGVVLATYLESPDVPEEQWDTLDVSLSFDGSTHYGCPAYYHCTKYSSLRENGSVIDGARGFSVGDNVICRCLVPKDGFGSHGSSFSSVSVVGHIDGPKHCSFRFVLVRISDSDLVPLEGPFGDWVYDEESKQSFYQARNPDSHKNEYVTIYDSVAKRVAKIVDPESSSGAYYTFPCQLEKIKPYLDMVALDLDTDLYRWVYQGNAPDEIQYASGSPNYKDDFSGDLLGVNPTGDPWSTYYAPNEVLRYFNNFNDRILTHKKIRQGDFSDITSIFTAADSVMSQWAGKSPAFKYETKSYYCNGPVDDSAGDIPENVRDEVTKIQQSIAECYAKIDYNKAQITNKKAFQKSLNYSYTNDCASIKEIEDRILSLGNAIDLDWSQLTLLVKLNDQLTNMKISAEASYAQIAAVQGEIDSLNSDNEYIANLIETLNNTINQLLEKGFKGDNCIKPDGTAVSCSSHHAQTAFGENEFWVCGKNVYNGMIVSLCDEWWKFIRLNKLPPVVPLAATSYSMNKLANSVFPGTVTPVGDIAALVAASVYPSELSGNIFDWTTLKRINEGCFHHTCVPAIKSPGDLCGVGSYQLVQTEIPNLITQEVHKTAINSRYEHIVSWTRMDNWMNTIALSTHTLTANPTWFFLSIGQQYRYSGIWIDTPLGSMAFHVPRLNAGLWYFYQIYQQTSVARQDFPIDSHFVAQQKHTTQMCLHVYIVQRRAITFYNKGGYDFVRQINTWGPYDCWRVAAQYEAGSEPPSPSPSEDHAYTPESKVENGGTINEITGTVARYTVDKASFPVDDPVCYVDCEGKRQKFFDLTNEQQNAIIGDRFYITSATDLSNRQTFPNQAFEVEVMAGCELYETIKKDNGTYDASKVSRTPQLELCIADLVKYMYSQLKSADSDLYGDKYFSYFRVEAKLI